MKDNTIEVTERLEFLAKQYDVFDCESDGLKKKIKELEKEGYKEVTQIKSGKKVLGLISTKRDLELYTHAGTDFSIKKFSICIDVFTDIVKADPTNNKMFVQWMLNIFNKLLKGRAVIMGIDSVMGSETPNSQMTFIDTTPDAVRFVTEDLPQAKEYLTLFEGNKRKKKFKELSAKNFSLKQISDYTDINQYKSLSQLFDAVDPFIERDSTEMESLLQRFVSLGEAIIPVKDRKFTVYVPLTRNASTIFEKYAGWCTARVDNSNFTSYTENHKKPNGKNSNLYIIINNKFFEGKSDEIYQVHFETNQLHDKSNKSISIYENVISKSEAICNYFYDELIVMAKECQKGIDNNSYLDYLIQFGFAESLFEIFEEDTQTIRIMNDAGKREIPKLPDLSRFKNLQHLIVCDTKLTELHSSVGNLKKLQLLTLSGNKITKFPKEISYCKQLDFINIVGNKITDFPSEMGNLDKTKGGSLNMMSLKEDEIGIENVNRLKELLPSVTFNIS